MALVGRKRGVLPRVAAVLPGRRVEGAGCSFLGLPSLLSIPLHLPVNLIPHHLYHQHASMRQAVCLKYGEVIAACRERVLYMTTPMAFALLVTTRWYSSSFSISPPPLLSYTITTNTHVNIITRTIYSHAGTEDASLDEGSPAAHRALRASH